MANLGTVLKQEIVRLVRKESKVLIEPLRKTNAAQRRELAALKREIAELQRALKAAQKALAKSAPPAQPAESEAGSAQRITTKGIQTLRSRLGLTAGELGLLTGASPQSVYNWEQGTQPRAAQREALIALRGLGKREVRARLESMAG